MWRGAEPTRHKPASNQPTVRDLHAIIVRGAEQRTKKGQPQRTLELALRACAMDGSGVIGFDGFRQAIRSLAPGVDDAQIRGLFDHHATVPLDVIAGSAAGEVNYVAFAKVLFTPEEPRPAPARSARAPPAFTHPWDEPAPPDANRRPVKQAWEEEPAPAPLSAADVARTAARAPLGPAATGGAAPLPSAEPPRPCASSTAAATAAEAREAPLEDQLQLAIRQINHGLGCEVRARPVLPAAERVTMGRSQQHGASRAIALLRALRAVEPTAPAMTEAQLAAALHPLARHLQQQPAGGGSPAFLRPAPIHELWRRSRGGDLQALVGLVCPITPADQHHDPAQPAAAAALRRADRMPAGMGRPGAAPPPKGPHPPPQHQQQQQPPPAVRAAAGPLQAAGGGGGDWRDALVVANRFDYDSGRKGARKVPPPPRAQLPHAIRYRPATTPAHLPSDFDPQLVTRSAQLPDKKLERAFVHGCHRRGHCPMTPTPTPTPTLTLARYNGLGKHNRAPNICATPGGHLVYCTAALGIVYDPATNTQRCLLAVALTLAPNLDVSPPTPTPSVALGLTREPNQPR